MSKAAHRSRVSTPVLGHDVQLVGAAVCVAGHEHRILRWVERECARRSCCAALAGCAHLGQVAPQLSAPRTLPTICLKTCVHISQSMSCGRHRGWIHRHQRIVALGGKLIRPQVAVLDVVQHAAMRSICWPLPLELEHDHATAHAFANASFTTSANTFSQNRMTPGQRGTSTCQRTCTQHDSRSAGH